MSSFKGKIAIYALTQKGAEQTEKICRSYENSQVFLPEKLKSEKISANYFSPGSISGLIKDNWHNYEGHIFIMAVGIVVRKIAPLLTHKTKDPAVVVCDEMANFAISLLSGHIGGANRLAMEIGSILEAEPVITTATDVQNLMAFDELAAINEWQIINPENIKVLNSFLLEKKRIALVVPIDLYEQYYANLDNLDLKTNLKQLKLDNYDGIVAYNISAEERQQPFNIPVLFLNDNEK